MWGGGGSTIMSRGCARGMSTHLCLDGRLMAEVMLEEIGRRPGAASKRNEAMAGMGGRLQQVQNRARSMTACTASCQLGAFDA